MTGEQLRRALRWGAVGLAVVAVIYVAWVFVAVTRAADRSLTAEGRGDAIVVLGAAQYNGEPSPVLERRLETALGLWEQGRAPLIVTTGANQPGDVFTEGFAGYRWLRRQGVADATIVVIVDGGDTYESLLATENQLGPGRSVLVVTDAYHARRSADVASEVGLDATVIAAGSDTSLSRRFRETVAVAIGRIIGYRRLSSLR